MRIWSYNIYSSSIFKCVSLDFRLCYFDLKSLFCFDLFVVCCFVLFVVFVLFLFLFVCLFVCLFLIAQNIIGYNRQLNHLVRNYPNRSLSQTRTIIMSYELCRVYLKTYRIEGKKWYLSLWMHVKRKIVTHEIEVLTENLNGFFGLKCNVATKRLPWTIWDTLPMKV